MQPVVVGMVVKEALSLVVLTPHIVFPENRGVVYMSDSGAPSTASLSPALWPPREFEHDAVQIVHLESDFICLQSTTPGERPLKGRAGVYLSDGGWTDQRDCHLFPLALLFYL